MKGRPPAHSPSWSASSIAISTERLRPASYAERKASSPSAVLARSSSLAMTIDSRGARVVSAYSDKVRVPVTTGSTTPVSISSWVAGDRRRFSRRAAPSFTPRAIFSCTCRTAAGSATSSAASAPARRAWPPGSGGRRAGVVRGIVPRTLDRPAGHRGAQGRGDPHLRLVRPGRWSLGRETRSGSSS